MTDTAIAPQSAKYVVPKVRIDLKREAPDAYQHLINLGQQVAKDLDPQLNELVKIRASILNNCAYCVDMHVSDARQQGEHERRLAAVAVWEEAPFFTARERAALALTDAVTLLSKEGVPDEVWAEAERHFDRPPLASLVFAIIVINSWNRIAVPSKTPAPPIS